MSKPRVMLLLQGGHKCRAHRPFCLPGSSLRCNPAGCNLAGVCNWGRPHCSCRANCPRYHKRSIVILSPAPWRALSSLVVSCLKRKLSCAVSFCCHWTRTPLQCITNFCLYECCMSGVCTLDFRLLAQVALNVDSHVFVVSQQWNVLHYRQWKRFTLHL